MGQVPEWLKGADCKSAGPRAYVGSNPTLPTNSFSNIAVRSQVVEGAPGIGVPLIQEGHGDSNSSDCTNCVYFVQSRIRLHWPTEMLSASRLCTKYMALCLNGLGARLQICAIPVRIWVAPPKCCFDGGVSSVGRALGCGPRGHGFDPRTSPHRIIRRIRFKSKACQPLGDKTAGIKSVSDLRILEYLCENPATARAEFWANPNGSLRGVGFST